ncbi:MAG TPA: lactate utilization protein [Bacillota bacterium]|nr:lactate utilization protein [Bacillota bacterium]HQC35777.1 lactate utilization protein [Bacillota bacterium]
MDFTKTKNALEDRGFKVSVFANAKDASDYLNKEIDNTTVSFGGSVTLAQMGLFESLSTHNEMFSHWHIPPGSNADEMRVKAATSESYLTSVNGLAETGEVINIDGTGNRVGSTCFGHKRLFFVVGCNKIEPTFEKALWRARNVAAPMNTKRLNRNTPCAIDGKCHDCRSEHRICNVLTVHWAPARAMLTEVILIDEDLGY